MKSNLKVYVARAMTGRIMEEIVKEATVERWTLEGFGFTVLDPVSEEGVKPKKKTLKATHKQMTKFWKRDKEMIRQAHVVLDMTPELKSEGVSHELGYARYSLWKPVVRVYPFGQVPHKGSVAWFEDDLICDGIEDAIYHVEELWGTRSKRCIWRAKLLLRCLPKWLWYQLMEWK